MPDIGLLQGPPRKRREAPNTPAVITEEVERAAEPLASAEAHDVAAHFAAVDRESIAIAVATSPVESPAPIEPIVVAPAAPIAPVANIAAALPPVAVAPATPAEPPSTANAPKTPAPARPMLAGGPPPISGRDLFWLALALLVIIGTGFGIRDPWPADEPRFAVIARDMVATGEWLFPRVGGDLYQDKPPLFFWMLAVCYSVLGSVRWSFLLPSLFAAGGVMFLVYDLGRRLVSREAGLSAALLTVCTLHFVVTMRGAQIDPTLCFLTTLSTYAFLRHLLLGPAWGWYALGGFAAGLGIITKGVGFLPILLLLPYVLMRAFKWQHLPVVDGGAGGWRWWLAPLGLVIGAFLWFVPMLIAVKASGAPEYAAYRDEILFKQTVGRYAAAWHHVKPWYYFVLEVIPALWLPWSLLLFWLVPGFRNAFRARDARVWLPLTWALLVLLFFSMSPGKRGVYILPALPALAIASLTLVEGVLARPGVRRAGWVLAIGFFLGAAVLAIAHTAGAKFAVDLLAAGNLSGASSLYVYLVICGIGLAIAWSRAPLLAWPVALGALAMVFSYWIAPAMNSERSASGFTRTTLSELGPDDQLALVAYKEQFLLYLDRPTFNFGHRRWLEGPQESYDASAWLNADAHRVLLVPEDGLKPCFESADQKIAGRSSDEAWFLIRGSASSDCASKGDATKAILYAPKTR